MTRIGSPCSRKMPDEPREACLRARLDPELRRPADAHRRVLPHRFEQAHLCVRFAKRGGDAIQHAQLRREPRPDLMDVPRTQRDDQIARAKKVPHGHMSLSPLWAWKTRPRRGTISLTASMIVCPLTPGMGGSLAAYTSVTKSASASAKAGPNWSRNNCVRV